MSIATRLDAVRGILRDTGLDAILVTNPANRRYLTGFTADDHAADESAGMVLVTRDAATLIVSPTNLPWAKAETDAAVAVAPFEVALVPSIVELTRRAGARQLAVEDATTPAATWFALDDALDATELVRAADAVDRLRAVKDADELALLREAARLTDAAFDIARERFAPGITERAGADLVREALRQVGSEGEAFDTIVASGPNAAKPHHAPSDRAIQAGEPVIIDMGARVSGYNGDLTRTFCLGTPGAELVTIYTAVLEAQLAGLNAIRAGVPASAPDLATREVFAGHGLEQHVIHGAGHGLGLRGHEAPSVRRTSDTPPEAGNVVTMEPGLYIDGWGGVRIEDVAIVRAGGHENITASPKGLEALARYQEDHRYP
jgi:Xaa-Pro aminopeptidase